MTAIRRLPTAWQLFAAATAVGLAFSAHHFVAMRMVDRPDYHTVSHALKGSLPAWYLWAGLAPLVVWFLDRVPFSRQRWLGPLLLHLAFGLVLVVVHALAGEVVDRVIGFPDDQHLPFGLTAAAIVRRMIGNFPFSLSGYAAATGLFLAYDYHQRYRERELTSARLAKELAEARLAGLRTQLGPHFLFNAMNTIAMLVRRDRRDDAIRTVAGLSELLREFLVDPGEEEAPLTAELETIRRYLEIERLRFEDRLRVEYRIAPDAAQVPLPRLLLQPIVENAIRHGIARRAKAGSVVIAARVDGGTLEIKVTDDGPGPDGGDQASPDAAGTGVGLGNVEARLAARYGDRATFTLGAAAGGGAVATLRIPIGPAGR